MTRCKANFAVLLVLTSSLAIAQSTGSGSGSTGSSGSSGGGTKGGTPTTGTVGTTTRGNSSIPSVVDMPRPITLSGRVVMEDGTTPSDKVSIERVCNGRARREAYTDSRGYFSFTIDNSRPQMMMQDASVGFDGLDTLTRTPSMRSQSGMTPSDPSGSNVLMGCELRAALAGAISDTIQLSGRRAFDDPNVGTIVLRRTSKVPGATVSLTSLQAPDKAKKAFDNGKKALAKGNSDGARAEFLKAVETFPTYAEAWAELSDLHMKAKELDAARDACEHAIAADSRYVRPYFTLIVLNASKEDWTQTQAASDKLLSLDSYDYPAAYYYNALANYKLRNLDKAEKSIRSARRLDANNKLPKISLLMAAIMMDRNDFAGAVQELRAFLDHGSASNADADYARSQLAFAQTKLASAAPDAPAAASVPK